MTPGAELERFSGPWAVALGEELEASAGYRRAAARWEGALVLELADGPGAAVFLDLERGRCREAGAATPERRDRAEFAIRARRATWERILSGDLDPIWAVMSGQLELAEGSIGRLAPFPDAARELVAAAARVGGRWPESEGERA